MGYILKTAAAAGGDATAQNQTVQIDQLLDTSGTPSVFKDPVNDLSVFIDGNGESVFFRTGSQTSILGLIRTDLSTLAGNVQNSITINSNITCTSFVAANPTALQILVQAFLAANLGIVIVNISYSEILASHTCYIVYQF
jgi:hypothetical protein